LGFRPKYLNGLHGPDIPDFWETYKDRAQGVMAVGVYADSWPTYKNKEYVKRFKKKWGEPPTHYGGTGAGGQIMHQAIEKAGTLDREKVRQVLLTEEFECILYPKVKFVNQGDYTNVNKHAFTAIVQWQDGKILTVFPQGVAVGKMIYPFPAKY
jgi:branched-chain amino acid transport system substrate-binding protein